MRGPALLVLLAGALLLATAPGAAAGVAAEGAATKDSEAGETVGFLLRLENDGRTDRVYSVEMESSPWTVSPSRFTDVRVPAGDARTIAFTVTPPADAEPGARATAVLKAWSCMPPVALGVHCAVDRTDEGSVAFTVRVVAPEPAAPPPAEPAPEAPRDAAPDAGRDEPVDPRAPLGRDGAPTVREAPTPRLGLGWPLLLGAASLVGGGLVGAWATRRARAPRERYRPLRTLGRGAYGTAVLARDALLKRDVVLKTLDLPDPERALAEARAAAAVGHANILQVHDVLERDGRVSLVLEHAPGGSLEARLAVGPLPPSEAVRLVRGVLSGLAAVHAAGILHRDLKPGNVLLGAAGEPKIADFGLASAARADATLASGAGQIPAGTILYLAPEQLHGAPASARSDLYAVAAVLYRALTGAWHLGPVPDGPLAAASAAGSRDPVLPVEALSPELNAVLARGLARDPTARYADAAEFLAALEAVPEARD